MSEHDINNDIAGTESSLSNWAGDYVTDMLGQTQALAESEYQGYDGPLIAQESDLQTDAFAGIAGLTLPDGYGDAADMVTGVYDSASDLGTYDPTMVDGTYDPTMVDGTYDPSTISTDQWNDYYAEQYMNPYLSEVLDPQLAELYRQADIQRLEDNSSLTKAGAYGGSRQAIMNSELNDNTARLANEVVGQGYSDAYDTGSGLFTSDQSRQLDVDKFNEDSSQFGATFGQDADKFNEDSNQFAATFGLDAEKFNEDSNQFGAGLGLDALKLELDAANDLAGITSAELNAERDIYSDQLDAGGIQRDITAEGVAADIAQFEEERDFPYNSLKFMHGMLDGMPLETQSTIYNDPSFLEAVTEGTSGILEYLEVLFGEGGVFSDIIG